MADTSAAPHRVACELWDRRGPVAYVWVAEPPTPVIAYRGCPYAAWLLSDGMLAYLPLGCEPDRVGL